MDFAALPPEINSALMYAGAGSGPILAAAADWDKMAVEAETAAGAYQSVIDGLLGESWQGPASVSMAAAALPYVAWMNATAAQCEQTATQAKAAAAAYEAAFAMTVPPSAIAANRAQLAALVATNFFGQNTPAIMANQAHYGEMWAQDAAAMYSYAGGAAAATALTPFTAPKDVANPAGPGNQSAAVAQAAGTAAATKTQSVLSQLAATVPQTLQGMSQPLPVATAGSGQLAGAAGAAAAGASGSAVSPGLAIDIVATIFELFTVGPFGTVSLGGAFGGLALTLGELAFPEEAAGLGALGGLALIDDYGSAGGLGGLVPLGGFGSMGGMGGAGGVGATWASMGKAASLGSLSVPQGWAAAAPSAMREVSLVSAGSGAAAAPVAAAGGTEARLAEMALASMAGRATAGTADRGGRDRAKVSTPKRSAAALPPDDPTTPDGPVTAIEIVAELRGLAELRDSGVLTADEFDKQRERLIDGLIAG